MGLSAVLRWAWCFTAKSQELQVCRGNCTWSCANGVDGYAWKNDLYRQWRLQYDSIINSIKTIRINSSISESDGIKMLNRIVDAYEKYLIMGKLKVCFIELWFTNGISF